MRNRVDSAFEIARPWQSPYRYRSGSRSSKRGWTVRALPHWDLRAALRQAPHAADYAEGWREMGRTDITEAVIRAAHALLIDDAMAALAGDHDRDRSFPGS